MFLGEYTHTFDEKGRLTLPAKWREGLVGGVVITRGFDDSSLVVFPKLEWEAFAEKVRNLPNTRQARTFRRHIFSGAADILPDRQGRVLIPQNLRDHAKLGSSAVIVGDDDRLEIWNTDQYNQSTTEIYSDPNTISDLMEGLGI